MARQARLFIPGCPAVLSLKGLGGADVFRTREAFVVFQAQIPISAHQERVRVHAYCMAPSGVMFLVSSDEPQALGRFVQHLNRQVFSVLQQQNDVHREALWAPRFKSGLVQPGVRSLQAQCYVETWAARLGVTDVVEHYPWGSYAAHIGHVLEPWLIDLPSYWALGNTPFERQLGYQRWCEQGLSVRDQDELTRCLRGGWLWSDDAFFHEVASMANRPPRPRPRGRPTQSGTPQNGFKGE